MEEYIVYQYDKTAAVTDETLPDAVCSFKKYLAGNREQLLKTILFTIAAGGKQRIFCVNNSAGELVHYSFVIPYCAKFSFMKKPDVCIGPCWTRDDHRGKGIYGAALNRIAAHILAEDPTAELYVLIRRANVSSTRGIQKASFLPAGKIRKTKWLKHYKKAEWANDIDVM